MVLPRLARTKSSARTKPPPVTITGVRIPADGTPAHLLSLTTTPTTDGAGQFFHHIPDLRRYWKTERAWRHRYWERIEVQDQHPESCDGIYYVFSSFARYDLPENQSLPAWLVIRSRHAYWGDVSW